MISGVPVDLDRMTADLVGAPVRIGLRDLWIEVSS